MMRSIFTMGILLPLFGLALLCFVASSPVELIGPALSPEAFKRAVSSTYVFTVFTSVSESNLYVYTSDDGTNFNLLKGPTYTPATGLIRDPSVILHTESVPVLLLRYLSKLIPSSSGKYYIACELILEA